MRRAAVLAFALALALPAAADIFLVRHAEKKNPRDDKSTLSGTGLKRAQDLKRALSSVDLKAVYHTEYERTRQTAAPTAAAHKLTPIELKSDDVKGLGAALRARKPADDILVVGHSDTVPDILRELGVSTTVVIGPNDYDSLFLVSPRAQGEPEFHVLHYGDAPAAMKRKP
jgi:broad specificity phosphatase PhoE